jgi:hypothetical protein
MLRLLLKNITGVNNTRCVSTSYKQKYQRSRFYAEPGHIAYMPSTVLHYITGDKTVGLDIQNCAVSALFLVHEKFDMKFPIPNITDYYNNTETVRNKLATTITQQGKNTAKWAKKIVLWAISGWEGYRRFFEGEYRSLNFIKELVHETKLVVEFYTRDRAALDAVAEHVKAKEQRDELLEHFQTMVDESNAEALGSKDMGVYAKKRKRTDKRPPVLATLVPRVDAEAAEGGELTSHGARLFSMYQSLESDFMYVLIQYLERVAAFSIIWKYDGIIVGFPSDFDVSTWTTVATNAVDHAIKVTGWGFTVTPECTISTPAEKHVITKTLYFNRPTATDTCLEAIVYHLGTRARLCRYAERFAIKPVKGRYQVYEILRSSAKNPRSKPMELLKLCNHVVAKEYPSSWKKCNLKQIQNFLYHMDAPRFPMYNWQDVDLYALSVMDVNGKPARLSWDNSEDAIQLLVHDEHDDKWLPILNDYKDISHEMITKVVATGDLEKICPPLYKIVSNHLLEDDIFTMAVLLGEVLCRVGVRDPFSVALLLIGRSQVGKSIVMMQLLKMMPPGAVRTFTSKSSKNFIGSLDHQFAFVDEVECLLKNWTASFFKALITGGAVDADRKNREEPPDVEGSNLKLVGCGNFFFPPDTPVDPAVAERVCQIGFEGMVDPKLRDKTLDKQCDPYIAYLQVYFVKMYLENYKKSFWGEIASNRVRASRQQNMIAGDWPLKFINNASSRHRVETGRFDVFITKTDLEGAIKSYMTSCGVDSKTLERNWMTNSLSGLADVIVMGGGATPCPKICRSCKTINPTKKSCKARGCDGGNRTTQAIIRGLSVVLTAAMDDQAPGSIEDQSLSTEYYDASAENGDEISMMDTSTLPDDVVKAVQQLEMALKSNYQGEKKQEAVRDKLLHKALRDAGLSAGDGSGSANGMNYTPAPIF